MALQPTTRYTVSEYLALERAACARHEYLDGQIYAMAGESPNHGRICVNLTVALSLQLRGSGCEVFSKDMKVYCPAPQRRSALADLFAYPDLVVVCGAMQFHDEVQDVLRNPTLLIEVLSPSTEAFDRGEKFYRYSAGLPTLMHYLLVAQDQPRIDHYARDAGGLWTLRMVAGITERLDIAPLGWTVPLAESYERVVFPPASADGTAREAG
jgi:Uma2 family endonuclease